MKIAVISDIHGNYRALLPVLADIERWQPNQVIVAGDIVNRGPRSHDCLQQITALQARSGWQLVRGNHEEFLLNCHTNPGLKEGIDYELTQFAHWSLAQIGSQIHQIEALPQTYEWQAADGSSFRVRHASMQGTRTGIYSWLTDVDIEAKIAPAPTVYVTAHTHEPLQRQINGTLVVNIGAVGSPFDGDARASYGRFCWQEGHGWQAEIVRLPYDVQAQEQDYVESGFLAEVGPFAQLMLVEHRRSGGLFFRWAQRYEQQVRAGELSLEASVHELLQDEDLRPFLRPPAMNT